MFNLLFKKNINKIIKNHYGCQLINYEYNYTILLFKGKTLYIIILLTLVYCNFLFYILNNSKNKLSSILPNKLYSLINMIIIEVLTAKSNQNE